jgi:hypothetical protein
MKSQIFAGTKEELTTQVAKWDAFIKNRLKQYQNHIASLSSSLKKPSEIAYDSPSSNSALVAGSGSGSGSSSGPVSGDPIISGGDPAFNPPAEVHIFANNNNNSSTTNSSDTQSKASINNEGSPRKVSLLFGMIEVPMPSDDCTIVYIVLGLFVLILIQFWRNRYLSSKLYALENKLEDIHSIVFSQKSLLEEFLKSKK